LEILKKLFASHVADRQRSISHWMQIHGTSDKVRAILNHREVLGPKAFDILNQITQLQKPIFKSITKQLKFDLSLSNEALSEET
jgi:hypothetical protein